MSVTKQTGSNSRISFLVPGAATLSLLGGCQLPPPAEAPPAQQVSIKCDLPTFSPIAGTSTSQEKGGIRALVTPVAFACARGETIQEAPTRATIQEQLTARQEYPAFNPQTSRMIEDSHIPNFTVSPDKLAFQITIKNNLPRVFRGSGTVVMFNVDGRNQTVNADQFSQLSSLIVPPQTEAQVTIYGPAVATLPVNSKMGIYLYDVVTKTDAAGNVQQKENFEWYYTYSVTSREEQASVTKTRHWAN